ncbi:MAG TPA: epimerase, partial [Micromonospora sp.]
LRTRTVPIPLPVLRALAAGAWWARLQPTEPGWLDLAAATPLMDCSRAHADLNWRPRRDAREALRELLTGIAEGAGTAASAMRVEPSLFRRFINGLPGHGNPA